MDISPLEALLFQMAELYKTLLETQKKQAKITPEIKEAVKLLTDQVKTITTVTEQEIQKAGLNPQDINLIMYGNKKEQMPPNLRKLLERALSLKADLEGCRNKIAAIANEQKKAPPKNQKTAAKKRQDKFKGVGSKKGWIPM